MLQKKKNCDKNQEKSNFLFTDRNNDIDSYSYGGLTLTVKVWSAAFFGFCRFGGNTWDSSDDDWTP